MIVIFITETIFLSQYNQNERKKNVFFFFLIFRHYYQLSHLVKFQQINSFIIKLYWEYSFYVLTQAHRPIEFRLKSQRGSQPPNLVNLFAFGCHVIDRAYVRVYRLYGWGRGDCQKDGRGVSDASWQVHIFYGYRTFTVSHHHIAGSCVNSSR